MPETKVAIAVTYRGEEEDYVLILNDKIGPHLPFAMQIHGETTEETAKRIARQQLSIEATDIDAVGWRDEIHSCESHYVVLFYAAIIDREIISKDGTWDWIPLQTVETMNLSFGHNELIKLI